ncbi:MAG: oligosaccharide flippase family protein [Bacteroidetes bacterium]|nr:oligosaccharide flippase family protein [Bacteroidota bacterium]
MASRTKLALYGFGTDVFGLIVLTVFGFIAAPIILNLTSQSLYGFWVTTISILGYLALTDLGLGMSLTRFVASLAKTNDAKSLNNVISTAFFAFCGVGLVFFIVGIGISPFISTWFKIPPKEVEQVLSAYRVAIISGAIALPLSVFGGVVVGFQKMAIINITTNIVSIIAIGLSIILLYTGIGLVALPLASLFTVIFKSIFSFFYARRYFPLLNIRFANFNWEDLKKLLSFGGYFQFGRVANTVALSTDNIVISGFMGAENVTPYAFTSKLPIIFSVTLAGKLPNAIFPAMTEMFANNEMDKLRQTYKRLTFFSVRFAFLAGAFIFIANPEFVSLWVGDQNYGGNFLNLVFVSWALLDTVYRGTTAIVFASGDMRNWTIASIAEAILNIAISISLVGSLGLVGVALGTLISKILTTGFYTPYWVCQKLNLPVNDLLKKSIRNPIIRSLPSIGLTFLISLFLPLTLGWFWIILIGLTIGVTNFLMFEGLALLKPTEEHWKIRLRKLILLQEKY